MKKLELQRSVPLPDPIGRDRTLLLRPLAYLKLMFFCHAATTEVGAFGISAADAPLIVEDVMLIRQRTSIVTVAFDDAAVADHFDAMADSGISPSRCGRIWIHTHPGDSAHPSTQDEHTFASSFAGCDWSVMAILARGGATSARVQFPAGPGGQIPLEIAVDWQQLPGFLNTYRDELPKLIDEWQEALERCVQCESATRQTSPAKGLHRIGGDRLPQRDDPDEQFWAYWNAWEEGAYV